jgi:predicted dehydrogenase
MKTSPIRWGIVATGWIAAKFAEALTFESARTGKSAAYAVASRSPEQAQVFAERWSIPRSYGSYEELFRDPNVDAVYIATPHNLHPELSIAALRAGKAVLCEKPVSLSARDLYPVLDVARESGRFFMEAMWMRFNPSVRKAMEWIDAGKIGPVRYIRSDFFLSKPYDPTSRYFDPALGGGALLDVGIYPVTLACMAAGGARPNTVSSRLTCLDNGVDLRDSVRFEWESGLVADLSSAIDLPGIEPFRSAAIAGDGASILLPFFWMAQKASLVDGEGAVLESFEAPFDCNGYEYELREVESCLERGLTESPVQTWADSIMVMELLDTIRKNTTA